MLESVSKIALVISIILEVFFWKFWTEFYFRYGIPVFRQRLGVKGPPGHSHLAGRLVEITKVSWLPNLIFEELTSGDVAFREEWGRRLFKFRVRYLPIMHGLIKVRAQEPYIIVTGMINWSVLAFMGAVAASLSSSSTDSTWVALVPLMGGFYIIQYFHYGVVCEEILSCYGRTPNRRIQRRPRS